MSNSAFNPSRFMALARTQWLERRRAWGVFVGVGALLYTLMLGLYLSINRYLTMNTSEQGSLFVGGLLLSGTVFASLYFSALRRPESALLLLMRPASVLEKWLLAVVTVLLLYPLAYTLVVTPLNALAGAIGHQLDLARYLSEEPGKQKTQMPDPAAYAVYLPLVKLFTADASARLTHAVEAMMLSFFYLYGTGFAVLGSVYFRKAAGPKTLVLAFALGLVAILLSTTGHFPMGELAPWAGGASNVVAWVISVVWWLGIPLLLWGTAARALYERDLT